MRYTSQGLTMLRTILLSDHVQVQGVLVRTLDSGKIVVSTGNKEFTGTPVEDMAAAQAHR